MHTYCLFRPSNFQEHIVLFFYYNIFIVSEQVFLRFFMNLSRYARMCNSSHHLQDATEKVFILHKAVQYKVFLFVLIYYIMCIKIVFQWRPYRGEGILATVVKSMMKKGVVIVEGKGKGTKYILKQIQKHPLWTDRHNIFRNGYSIYIRDILEIITRTIAAGYFTCVMNKSII